MADSSQDSAGLRVRVDGRELRVAPRTLLASVLCNDAETRAMRRSVRGSRRAPLCGMGICFECRATVDGRAQVRTCTVVCRDGMEVRTDG